MAVKQLMLPANRAFNSNGLAIPGAKALLYLSGGTTPAIFYADAARTVSLGSTITANGQGRFAPAYQDEAVAYRLIVQDAAGAQLDDLDPFYFGTVGIGPIGPTGPTGPSGPTGVATRTDLAAIAIPAAGTARFLTESGREGVFAYDASNLSSQVAADTLQGVYVAPASAPTGASGAWVRRYDGVANVKWYGAKGDGVTNDLPALQAAAARHKCVYVPTGTYPVNGTVNLSLDGSSWYGDGINASIITSSSTNTKMMTVGASLQGVQIRDLQLTRSVTAVAGGDGLDCSTVSLGQASLQRLLIQKQYNGLSLGPTDYSAVEKVIVQKCIQHGFNMTNTATDGACQWSLNDCLSQMNGGHGYVFTAIAGPAQVTLGTYTSIATFGNSGNGIRIAGLADVPVHDFRLVQGFIGEDGASEILLDTFGRNHQITGGIIELAGRRTTGPALTTAASLVGSGIEVTGNNVNVNITGVVSDANSYDGYDLNGTRHAVNGCTATNNGQSSVVGRRNGIRTLSGKVVILGGFYGNSAGVSQSYGAFAADGNNITIGFTELASNGVSGWGATVSPEYITAIGNLPNTLNTLLSPAGSVLVGGNATGGNAEVGTINVAGGLKKNNVAYTNP